MNVRTFLFTVAMCAGLLPAVAQQVEYKQVWSADKGNGTYVNPVINGDFPDIDVIRVEDTYYMVSTTMYHFPGATILKSKDLVNWEYCANPLQKIDDNDAYNLMNGACHYSQGQWAASLNYYEGKFYLYFICYGRSGVDDTQNILLTATDPEGTWTMKKMTEHYYDSGWLFDDGENGDGYLYVACGIGDIWVNKLNAKTLQKISSERVISVGNGCEGSHMYHIGDYYYIYATYGGTEGSQTIFRSRNPMGPYEEHNGRVFANQKIHQGALIETQTGEWWTMLFKDAGAIGRIPYLEPVQWVDGWPIIGNNGIDVSKGGAAYKKPDVGQTYEKKYLPTNDAFTDTQLGMQWQWNHNPDNSAWSLTERRGWLRLYTANVTNELTWARNSLSQRILGYSPNDTPSGSYKNSCGMVKMDLSGMQEGDIAGLAVFQNPYSFIGVKVVNGKKMLYSERCTFNSQVLKKAESKLGSQVTSDVIYLRATVNFGTNSCHYYYSYDAKRWNTWGVTMTMGYTLDYFVGQRFYLFNYATIGLGGYVDFDWFSTEQSYTEGMFGPDDPFADQTEADQTLASLSAAATTVKMEAGNVLPLELTMTAQSGKTQNVTAQCEYTISNPKVLTLSGSHILAKKPGEADIRATYTDPFGHSESVSIHVTVTAFAMSREALNPSLKGAGTLSVSSKLSSLKTAKDGLGGWRFASGIDLSAYNYLVIHFARASSCSPTFRIYDCDNTSATPYVHEIGTNKIVKIDLHNMKTADGKTLDPSRIYLAAFSSTGSSAMYINSVFLSNDGETEATSQDITLEDIRQLIATYLTTGSSVKLSDIMQKISEYLNQ